MAVTEPPGICLDHLEEAGQFSQLPVSLIVFGSEHVRTVRIVVELEIQCHDLKG